ncbi:MAG: MFS transporter [Streptosporangiaceae bacterium]
MQLTDTVSAGPVPTGPRGPGGLAQRRWALALTSVAFFMVALDSLVVITALPAIQASLNGSVATLDWAVNAYNLAFAAGIIAAAALGDRLGRRRVYVIGLLGFTLASAACALAPNASALIAARTIQGLGAAVVTPLSLTILTSAFPAARRGTIVGIWGGIGGLAVASGPLVGGAVVQGLDWHWIFWVNVPVGLVPGLVMQAVGFAWIVYLAARSAGYVAYVAPLLFAGVGISMALPCVSAAGLNAVSPSSLGRAAGVLNTMQQFGAVFGIAVATTVFNAHGSLASAAAVTSGYRPALAVAAACPSPAPSPP